MWSIGALTARVAEVAVDRKPILILDQFEEFVTLFEQDSAKLLRDNTRALQQEILVALLELINTPLLPVKLLFAFREDYLAKLQLLIEAAPGLRDQYVRLLPLQVADLPEIIWGPFEKARGAFGREPFRVLAGRLEQAIAREAKQETLNLTSVQIICSRLWDTSDPDALFQEKGVQGVLGDYVAETVHRFLPERRDLAVALLSHMVTAAGTRNVISSDDLIRQVKAEEKISDEVQLAGTLQTLEDEKLIRRELRRDVYVYEIVSEFLVPGIVRESQQRQLRLERAEAERQLEARRQLQGRQRRQRITQGAILALLGMVTILSFGIWLALDQRNQIEQLWKEARGEQTAAAADLARAQTAQELAEEKSREAETARQAAEAKLAAAVDELEFADLRPRETDEAWAAVLGLQQASIPADARPQDIAPSVVQSYVFSSSLSHPRAVYSAVFSRDGGRVATAGEDGAARIWDLSPRQERELPAHSGRVNSVAFSPDGLLLATAGDDGTARVWNLATATFQQVAELRRHTGRVLSVAFHPSGEFLVTASADRTALVWDPFSDESWQLLGHTAPVTSAAFSPDGGSVVTTSDDGTARLWDTATLQPLVQLRRHRGAVTGGAFSPDGHFLVTSGADRTALVWDLRTSEPIDVLGRHTDRVIGADFSIDGLVATASADRLARVWDPETGTVVVELRGHTDRVYSAVFSADGRQMITASRDRTARIWTAS